MGEKFIVKMWSHSNPNRPWYWAGTEAKNFDPAQAQRFTREAAEEFAAVFRKNAVAHAAKVGLEPLHVVVVSGDTRQN